MKLTTPVDSEFASLALQISSPIGHMSFWLFPIHMSFCLRTLMKLTTPVDSELPKRTHVILSFPNTYVLLLSDFMNCGTE